MLMTKFNPYAPPKVDFENDSSGIYRYGDKGLFVPFDNELPNRCVKCNDLAVVTKTQRFSYNAYPFFLWFIVGAVLLMVLGFMQYFGLLLLVFILMSLLTQKKARLGLGLCQKHHKERWVVGILCVLSQLLIFVLLFKFIHHALMILSLLFVFVILLFVLSHYWRLAAVSKIDKDGVYLKSLGKPFLESFEKNF